METDRANFCGCKGIRTCFKCEQEFGIKSTFSENEFKDKVHYSYCNGCDKFWEGWSVHESDCPNHAGRGFHVPGVFILEEFLDVNQESELMTALDELPWDPSQSGRRKQNFGPKCNFKKRKLKLGEFSGFPMKTKFVQDKFEEVELLKEFRTIEQCSLEYDETRGSCIEPHVDDCWVWGERIVTVNLNSDSVLTLRRFNGPNSKYNLDCVSPPVPVELPEDDILLRVPMPARSLLVLYGELRYHWEHFIYRSDIRGRRVCLAYREFTPPYLPGGQLYQESLPVWQRVSLIV